MYVSDLALSNFRSYAQLVLAFEPGVTTFVGQNGQGKTNIVEAVEYLATLHSHRVAHDSALIRQGSEAAVIQSRLVEGNHSSTVEVEIYAGRANRARLNRAMVRPPEILGNVKAVVFAPEDLELVRGDPGIRRAFLDDIMIQVRPRFAGIKVQYDKVTRQRAAFLKAAGAARRRGQIVDQGALDVWNAQAARLGAEITVARAAIVRGLRPHVTQFYRAVSGGKGSARIDYVASASKGFFDIPAPSALMENGDGGATNSAVESVAAEELILSDVQAVESRLITSMEKRCDQEIERGVNLVGPHRDEVMLSLGTLPAKGYASHGESWSYALALRLAAWKYLCEDATGVWDEDQEPILILDDVFAELDVRRRVRLAQLVLEAQQVFVTAAVGDDLPSGLSGTRLRVHEGVVDRVT